MSIGLGAGLCLLIVCVGLWLMVLCAAASLGIALFVFVWLISTVGKRLKSWRRQYELRGAARSRSPFRPSNEALDG